MSRWTQADTTAQLTVGQLTATLDLMQPSRGLYAWQIGDRALGELAVLGLDLPTAEVGELSLPETYVRGEDLVATYVATAARPWRVQAYWRAADVESVPGAVVIDLQVSITTALLDAHPYLDVIASLPFAKPLETTAARFGFALESAAWSYWQAAHPDDPCTMPTQRDASQDRLQQRLFDRFLEKGVILRSRLRGTIVPSGTDVDAIFAEFAEAPLPLTT